MVGLPTFDEMWDRLLDHLRDHAEWLGVPAENIVEGVIGEPTTAPFIYVYAIPNDDLQLASSSPFASYADMPIVVGVEPALDTSTATRAAMRMVVKVRSVLRSLRGYTFSTTPPSYVGQHSNAFMLQTDCIGTYLPYEVITEEEPPPPPPDEDSPLLTELAAYWKVDEASGTRVDSAGDHDLSGPPSLETTAGLIGQAALLDIGTYEPLVAADHDDLRMSTRAWSMWLWFKMDTLPPADGTTAVLVSKWGASSADEYMVDFYRYPGESTLRLVAHKAEGGAAIAEVSTPVTTGVWHSILVYHDPDAQLVGISLDNASAVTASVPTGVGVTTMPLRLGGFYNSERNLGGALDEIGIWHRLLTSDERAELYNAGAGITYPFT